MFDALKRFIDRLADLPEPDPVFSEDDFRLAAVALMVHVAHVDGETVAAERDKLQSLVEERFGLDRKASRALLRQAEASDRVTADFSEFTDVLKRHLDEEARARVVMMMWDIAEADGRIHEFEENMIKRITELLDVSPQARRRAMDLPPDGTDVLAE
ncbi:TerB family tellurite resistance protein [Beijerinckia mobilis]|uniref:tellurite resistance TerB family protein n=1 Tax=Beijerinckia mobilis TaxID=231434 RepID=UPI0005516FAC|nr:TerB family tellurite resistance protein [Beijerinckia mobilis]